MIDQDKSYMLLKVGCLHYADGKQSSKPCMITGRQMDVKMMMMMMMMMIFIIQR